MKIRKKATWNEVIERGERAWHGTTDVKLDLADLADVPIFSVNGIIVSKNQNGTYHIGIDLGGVLCFDAPEAQVVSILERLGALDGRWE